MERVEFAPAPPAPALPILPVAAATAAAIELESDAGMESVLDAGVEEAVGVLGAVVGISGGVPCIACCC